MNDDMDRRTEHWMIEKKIPVAVILTLVMQTLAVLIFFTRMDSRVVVLEDYNKTNSGYTEKVIRMDEKLTALQGSVSELKSMISTRQMQDKL